MKTFLAVVIVLILVGVGVWGFRGSRPVPLNSQSQAVSQQQVVNMEIKSPAFGPNQNIPAKYTCDGEGVNPPLEIAGVPEGAQSLVLIMDDPDAAGTWVHWTLWNIDPATKVIEENSVPSKAIQGQTSSGQNQYGGPCPPSGTHRYIFKLYALDTKLNLPSYSTADNLTAALQGRILAESELTGLYNRADK